MSTLKSGYNISTPEFDADNLAKKADIQEFIDDVEVKHKAGLTTVSSGDLYLKVLEEALQGVASNFSITKINTGADEYLRFNLEATGILSGRVPVANGSGGWAWAAQAGGGAAPVDISVTAGENLSERDFVYISTADDKAYKVDIDADPILIGTIRGIVNESGGITSSSTGSVRIFGEVSGFTGLTAWREVFASSTAGGYTQTKPEPAESGSQVVQVRIGFAVTTSAIVVDARATPCQFMKRKSMADDATLTIKHHTDVLGRSRRMRAFLTTLAPGNSIETYGSANQDSDVALRFIAGYGSDQCTGGTPSASSLFGGSAAANAFDNNNATYWASQTPWSTPEWIEYDFGSNKTIRRYTIRARDGGGETQAPKTFKLQYHDGATWQDADTQTSLANWSAGEQRTFDVANAYTAQRWRISTTVTQDNTIVAMAEIEMMEADTKDKLAQSFQLGSTSNVSAVKLWLKKTGTPTGTLTARIETDNAGSPSGTLVDASATITVAESTLGTSYAWISFTFPAEFSLSNGVTYWIVLSTDRAAHASNYVQWGADGSSPGYTDGQMLNQKGSTWSAESKDAVFDVLGPGISFDTQLMGASWGSNVGEVEMVMGDGSYANLDTQSTIKNTKGSTADIVFVVELE